MLKYHEIYDDSQYNKKSYIIPAMNKGRVFAVTNI